MSSSDWEKQIAEWEAKAAQPATPTPAHAEQAEPLGKASTAVAQAPTPPAVEPPAPTDIDYASLSPDASRVTEGRPIAGPTAVPHPKAPAQAWCDQMQAMASPEDGSTQALAEFVNGYANR